MMPAQLRKQLFLRIQCLDLSAVRSSSHGDLISRIINDAGGLESALWSLGYIATGFFGVLIALIMLIVTDWRLAILGLILLVPTIPIGPRILTPLAEQASYESKQAHGRLSSQLWENLANQLVVRVFGLGAHVTKQFDLINQQIQQSTKRYNVYSYFSNRVPWIAVEFIDVIVLACGCWMLIEGHITTGALVSFYLLFAALATHAYAFATSISRLVGVSASMRRIEEFQAMASFRPDFLNESGEQAAQDDGYKMASSQDNPSDQHAPVAPSIRFDDVGFIYPDSALVEQISGLSFELPAGQLTAFVGSSGSGKSTAIQLLLGLLRPRRGSIWVNGERLDSIGLERYWSTTSVVFQDSLLFHGSIAENIRAGFLKATEDEIAKAADQAGLSAWIESLPMGIATLVSADSCSGGQRQRIAIARALIRRPGLLVLDEPTSALDTATASAVMNTILELVDQRSTVLVTHRLYDAAKADWILVFDQGRVIQEGTHRDLSKEPGMYRELWQKQEGFGREREGSPGC
jgi:ATP-binding cassette subfamily B protein